MMAGVLPRAWRIEFELAAENRKAELTYKEQMRRAQVIEREEREFKKEKEREREDLAALVIAFASPEEVAAFRAELDDYDAKTVEALMENEEAMEGLKAERDKMLREAATLPDGRRVFKTLDGTQVFDEHGQEVPSDIVDPASIDDRLPRWQPFQNVTDRWDERRQERARLANFHATLDDARDRVAKGEITKAELKQLESALKADMPDSVRAKVGLEKPEASAEHERKPEADAAPNSLDAMLRKGGLGPAASTP